MKINFVKMHGVGNDYIYIDCLENSEVENINLAALALRLSDRHTGIGGDGLVLIRQSKIADARMQMFNADGSEGRMCGNAIRCVGKYLYDNKHTSRTTLTIETLAGVKELKLLITDEKVDSVAVDMGIPSFEAEDIPLSCTKPLIGNEIILDQNTNTDLNINLPLSKYGKTVATAVSVGNPHLVIPVESTEHYPLHQLGPMWERHSLFPDKVNTEIVEIVSPTNIKMRVWERGSGETMACGTGACASVAALAKMNLIDGREPVQVSLLGGVLTIQLRNDNHIIMTGPAAHVFSGTIEI